MGCSNCPSCPNAHKYICIEKARWWEEGRIVPQVTQLPAAVRLNLKEAGGNLKIQRSPQWLENETQKVFIP